MSRHLKTYLEASQQIEPIEISLLTSSNNQIRTELGDISELCNSIRVHGLLQPILVRPRKSKFEIICGHRRFEACRRLMKRHVDCIIRDLDDISAYELSIIENVQRQTLSPIEEARAYKQYVFDFGWGGVSDLARKIGKSQEYVSHRILLLDLPPEILQRVSSNKITVGQAQEIVWIRNPEAKSAIGKLTERERLTVKEIRKIKHELENEKTRGQDSEPEFMSSDDDEDEEEKQLSADKKAVDDAILSLRVALVRLDSILSRISSKHTKSRLMSERYELHGIIDRLISSKTELKKQQQVC